MNEQHVNWSQDDMLEVSLATPDDFLKVKETLTRMGVAGEGNKLYQSCYLLHKRGRYYILSFLELFILDGRPSTLSLEDIQRRNTIATLLSDWGLLTIVNPEKAQDRAPMRLVKVIPFRDKDKWELIPKYTIGKRRK